MNYIDLILWCAAVYGCSNIIVFSTLLSPFRHWVVFKKVLRPQSVKYTAIYDDKHRSWELPGKLINCIMCMGFWIGLLIGVLWKSPTSDPALDGFVGSAICWWIFLFLAPRQATHG